MQNSGALPDRLRRTLLALGTTLLCLVAPLAPADDLQDAQQLLQSGQRDQALERVNRVIAEKPKDAQARFLKGVILTEQGKQAEAIDLFTGLTRDYPNLPEPYNNLAVIYAGQGQYEKARTALEQSIRTHPSYATAYENLGDVYAKLASQAYGKALQLDATNTGAQNKLSLVRELVGSAEPVQLAKATPDKPAETPKPAVAAVAAAPAADASAEVLKAVTGWAEAWSRKDADAYLAFYAPEFAPPGNESRAEWAKTRRERIAAPKSISVSIESPKVTLRGSDQAVVSFRQNYRSDRLKSTNRKTLDLVKTQGGWRILKEQAGK